jgi:hypothetical protein
MAPTLQENDFDRVKRRGRSFSPPGRLAMAAGPAKAATHAALAAQTESFPSANLYVFPLYIGYLNRRMRGPSHGPT